MTTARWAAFSVTRDRLGLDPPGRPAICTVDRLNVRKVDPGLDDVPEAGARVRGYLDL